MPVLGDVLAALPAQDIGRLGSTGSDLSASIVALRPQVLPGRGVKADWSWRKTHAVETALWRDAPVHDWLPGPNDGAEGNRIERDEGEGGQWLYMSQGTDWQAFQGGFRVLSDVGVRPRWITFKVRIATPALSAASLAFSNSDPVLWGMRPIILFGYRGDDASARRRCFMVEVPSTDTNSSSCLQSHACDIPNVPTEGQAFDVAMNLDWDAGTLSVFINGLPRVTRAALDTSRPIRVAAIYNWRSDARSALSELMLGDACPYDLACPAAAQEPPKGRLLSALTQMASKCPRRRTRTPPKLAELAELAGLGSRKGSSPFGLGCIVAGALAVAVGALGAWPGAL